MHEWPFLKPQQEVKWCFAPGHEPQPVHSLKRSLSSAHDGTPRSEELQRDKTTNAIQTVGTISTSVEKSHEIQPLVIKKIFTLVCEWFWVLDVGSSAQMWQYFWISPFGNVKGSTGKDWLNIPLNQRCAIRTVEFHPPCLWLLWPLCTFHHYWHGRQRLRSQQSKTLHKTSQILVWNPAGSRVKFTKLWISEWSLMILSFLSCTASILASLFWFHDDLLKLKLRK